MEPREELKPEPCVICRLPSSAQTRHLASALVDRGGPPAGSAVLWLLVGIMDRPRSMLAGTRCEASIVLRLELT
jgi:hypothetical protein